MEGLGFLGAENTLRAKMLIIILVVVNGRPRVFGSREYFES